MEKQCWISNLIVNFKKQQHVNWKNLNAYNVPGILLASGDTKVRVRESLPGRTDTTLDNNTTIWWFSRNNYYIYTLRKIRMNQW